VSKLPAARGDVPPIAFQASSARGQHARRKKGRPARATSSVGDTRAVPPPKVIRARDRMLASGLASRSRAARSRRSPRRAGWRRARGAVPLRCRPVGGLAAAARAMALTASACRSASWRACGTSRPAASSAKLNRPSASRQYGHRGSGAACVPVVGAALVIAPSVIVVAVSVETAAGGALCRTCPLLAIAGCVQAPRACSSRRAAGRPGSRAAVLQRPGAPLEAEAQRRVGASGVGVAGLVEQRLG
jgi:hypothetical protein